MTSPSAPRSPSSPGAAGVQRPLVLVPACSRQLGAHPFQVVGQKYLDAVRLAGALPLVVPNSDETGDAALNQILTLADGLFLTGSPSNVHPRHFGEAVHDSSLPLDPSRDAWTLAAISRALAIGLPIFAVCRGFQEINVALGGSLHQAVQEQAGLLDHRARDSLPVEGQYGPAHDVLVEPGGKLAALLGQSRFRVNSLHGQGVRQLAPGLAVEARAPDGLVEAFSVPAAAGFALAVQWHPEWWAAENPVSMRLLQAFGAACQAYRDTHRPPSHGFAAA